MDKNAKDIFQYALGATITIGFFVTLYILATHETPAGNKDAINIILGALVSAFTGGVVGYFFGSSKGSSEKNDLISGNK